MFTSSLASEIGSITQNAPLKYAFDSISIPETQQTAYDLLAHGGKLAVVLEPSTKTTKEKDVFWIGGFLRSPPNIKLLEELYHDNLERLLKDGVIKVSRNPYMPFFCLD